jgi:hypothetical protein
MTDNFARNGETIFKNEKYNVKWVNNWINNNNFTIFGQLDQLDFNNMPKGHKNIVYNRSLRFYDFIERDCRTYNINELLCEFIVLMFSLILVCHHMLQSKEVILCAYLFWNIFECYFLVDHLMVIIKYTKILYSNGKFLSNIGFVGNICNNINTFGKYNYDLESTVGSITLIVNIVTAIYFTHSEFVNFANIVLYQLIISGCVYIYYSRIEYGFIFLYLYCVIVNLFKYLYCAIENCFKNMYNAIANLFK